MKRYLASDIFKEDPDDPSMVNIVFPEEILENLGITVGDTVIIEVIDGKMIINKAEGNNVK
jgi:hypothetical protein